MDTVSVDRHLLLPLPHFEEAYSLESARGELACRDLTFAFVALARNCEGPLRPNLEALAVLGKRFRDWRLYVEENDSEDGTATVLAQFAERNTRAFVRSRTLGRQHYGQEFAGPRTIALAEYRSSCQEWVRGNFSEADYVVIVDLDAWGGWSHGGFMSGVGMLETMPDAYGMASVSIMQHPAFENTPDGQAKPTKAWLHYDAWALRLNSYWDDYTAGHGGWKHHWIPPVGSPPVRVCSAFGGMTIYRTAAFLAGTYDGRTDCEHVSFHRSVAAQTGQHLYLCPSMRMVMYWVTDGGQHGDD